MHRCLFFMTLLSSSSLGCGSSSDGSGGGDATGTGNKTTGADKCESSQGLSEACCTELGIDACGAGLFCAAFDGRTVATCYPDRIRMDGEECNADTNCTSLSCHPNLHRCRAMPTTACETAIGCSDEIDGNYACYSPELVCRKTDGGAGSRCDEDVECTKHACVDGACDGPPCEEECLGCPAMPTGECNACVNQEAEKGAESRCLIAAINSAGCQAHPQCPAFGQCFLDNDAQCKMTHYEGGPVLSQEAFRACGGCPPA